MKTIKLFALFTLLTSMFACSQYRIAEVTSSSTNINKETLIQENDTFKIKYSFWGNDGKFSFSFDNKLNIPVYIDWSKCWFYINKTGFQYYPDVVAPVVINTTPHSKFSTSPEIKITHPQRITFIPPHASYNFSYYTLSSVNSSPNYTFHDSTINNSIRIGVKNFTAKEAPATMRNFLTYSITENFEKEIYIDQYFWVDKIYHVSRKNLDNIQAKTNRYWYQEEQKP